MTPFNDDKLADICKALGHPARISILRQLIKEDRCICGRIVEALPLAQSTVSQHLKVLKEAGLVRGEIEGPKTCYCIDKETLFRLGLTMDSLMPENEVQP
ncbi:metalloregulator ArsR/SmtB family transcription factor [Pseudodesulfovibrio sp. zrk46]|uniref:ArsR/SmtB family transcription factor n=1 Tax=Pseudodesulfovibrio sp. zrk46 TaxID=2725288 RepID=UPI0014491FCD|nr:metalloregulator ArsR/SmtB family transcription factor [Pseudodesulfovibrio sp. zrk46]QJB54999.1 winged helix-turn-helix transcriptional regulator [Pseudodesulfovibrio sp. zrk46]